MCGCTGLRTSRSVKVPGNKSCVPRQSWAGLGNEAVVSIFMKPNVYKLSLPIKVYQNTTITTSLVHFSLWSSQTSGGGSFELKLCMADSTNAPGIDGVQGESPGVG